MTKRKFSKAQILKIIQSGGFFPGIAMDLGNLGKTLAKDGTKNLSILLAKDVLPELVSNMASNADSNVIDKLGRKIIGQGAGRAGKEMTLFISNEDVDDIIKIVGSLEKSGVIN